MEPPHSPCVSICQLDFDDVCIGCGRTKEEIMQWAAASPARQWEIVENALERLADTEQSC